MNNIAFDEIPGGLKITAVNHKKPSLITTVKMRSQVGVFQFLESSFIQR